MTLLPQRGFHGIASMEIVGMSDYASVNTYVSAIHGETKQMSGKRLSGVLVVLVALITSGLCLKAHSMQFVWFWSTWACTLIGLIFNVHGSWPRALLFNAGVAAATLAVAEAYFSFEETEPPTHAPEYIKNDPVLGWSPREGIRTRATKFFHGRSLYDVTYTIDSNGLRISPPAGDDSSAGTVLFFGCSFTFGTGLQDDETLPYQVGVQSEGRWRTVNFGVGGYGPHQMLAALESGRVRRVLDSPPRHAFFVAIASHLVRVGGRSAVFGHGGPRFRIDPDGIPRLHGHFGDEPIVPGFLETSLARADPSAPIWIRWQLRKSAIYRSFINTLRPSWKRTFGCCSQWLGSRGTSSSRSTQGSRFM